MVCPLRALTSCIGFAQRLQAIIDAYNAGSSSSDHYFNDLVAFAEGLKNEDERSVRKEKWMRAISVVVMCSLLAGVAFGETTITINGKTIRASGNNITVKNGTVIVDGRVLSGDAVEGSGKSATEQRVLGDFNALNLDISADVTVTAGKKRQCTVIADDNILPLILTECSDNTLRISAKESYSSTQKVRIVIKTPLLTSAEINGSGNIDITEVTKDQLALAISGSGGITAKGKVAKLRATINGSGDVHAAALKSETATITINGSGDANVYVTDALTAKVHGSGDITYIGSPSKVHTSVAGSGGIAKK